MDKHAASLLPNHPDMHTFNLSPSQTYFVKLRPGLRQFLDALSSLFELHVYTMGSRDYARKVVSCFDPTGSLFHTRVLSRDDNLNSSRKDLRRIFPTDDRTVLVLDDRADVWDYCDNLLPIAPYEFFVGVGDLNRRDLDPSKTFLIDSTHGEDQAVNVMVTNDKDEDTLAKMQIILSSLHRAFFSLLDQQGVLPDIKELIKDRRAKVLAGTSLVFSGAYPLGISPSHTELWRLSVLFGAACSVEISPSSTTHLISFRVDTQKAVQARSLGIMIVTPQWLFACFRAWQKIDLHPFILAAPQDLELDDALGLELDNISSSENASDDDKSDSDDALAEELERDLI